jgi:hypothetical protein
MTHVFVTNIQLHQKLVRDSICIHTPVVSWAIITCHWCWYGYSFLNSCLIRLLPHYSPYAPLISCHFVYSIHSLPGFRLHRLRFLFIALSFSYPDIHTYREPPCLCQFKLWCIIFSTQCLRYRQMTRLVCMLQCITLPTGSIYARRCNKVLSWVTTWVAAQSG